MLTNDTVAPTIIYSRALYPENGVAHAGRHYSPGYPPVGPPWPALAPGDAIRVFDDEGWDWPCVVESVDPAEETAVLRVTDARVAQPFPTVGDDGRIVLPNMGGHAHTRGWRKGDIVQVHGATYRIARQPKLLGGSGSKKEYYLETASPEQLAVRPGRVQFYGEREARRAVGSCVQTSTDEWLRVVSVERRRHTSAEGDEDFGSTWIGVGKHVPESRAHRINALHGPSLSNDLHAAGGTLVATAMPDGAAVLIPRDSLSRAATGERVAAVAGAVLHERAGDPDMIDSWHHYVVRIEDAALVARVKRFVGRAK